MGLIVTLVVLAFVLLPTPLRAQNISSVYIDFDLSRCEAVEKIKETGSLVQRCTGAGDFPFFVAEDDLRFFVGYGPGGRKQKSFSQSLAHFNTIHNRIEFRIRLGQQRPFASILRYHTDGVAGERDGQVLVVTKIEDDEACHVAYVDALANVNPNALAQQAADAMAASFDCQRDEPKIVGARGRSPM